MHFVSLVLIHFVAVVVVSEINLFACLLACLLACFRPGIFAVFFAKTEAVISYHTIIESTFLQTIFFTKAMQAHESKLKQCMNMKVNKAKLVLTTFDF